MICRRNNFGLVVPLWRVCVWTLQSGSGPKPLDLRGDQTEEVKSVSTKHSDSNESSHQTSITWSNWLLPSCQIWEFVQSVDLALGPLAPPCLSWVHTDCRIVTSSHAHRFTFAHILPTSITHQLLPHLNRGKLWKAVLTLFIVNRLQIATWDP